MGKQRNTILVLGEGPTEFYYLKSLSDVYKGLTIKPDYPKHTNLQELEAKIVEGIQLGYRYIFCVIDMDNKGEEPVRSQYAKLKNKYSKPINKPKQGIYSEVFFFETHLCTELFFLYYFDYKSRPYDKQKDLLEDLNVFCEYVKTEDFFKKCKGLHPYFEKCGGKLIQAIKNSNRSLVEKEKDNRNYTYSELGKMFEHFENIEK
jgi:hypothetical protein